MPTAQHVSALRTVEVVVKVPPTNFVPYIRDSHALYGNTYVPANQGVAGVLLAVGLLAAMDYAGTTEARKARDLVGKSVEDLDLRGTVMAHFHALYASAPGAPTLKTSDQGLPEGISGSDLSAAMRERANASKVDAVLYVSVTPAFRDASGYATVFGSSILFDRSGEVILSTRTEFVGPSMFGTEQSDVARWWADSRYRRFLTQGIRAVLLPLTDTLRRPPSTDAERADLLSRIRWTSETGNARGLRSTKCPFESDDARVIYRFERTFLDLRSSAYCPGETLELLRDEIVPGISWVTPVQPAPVAPTKKAGN